MPANGCDHDSVQLDAVPDQAHGLRSAAGLHGICLTTGTLTRRAGAVVLQSSGGADAHHRSCKGPADVRCQF